MDEEEGAIDWPKVFLTLILATGMVGGGFYVYKARKAAAARAATEVKDYKGLFTQRGDEPKEIVDPNALPLTKPSPHATSSILLQVDEAFKTPVVVKSTEPAPPVAVAEQPAKPQPKTVAAPAKPAYKPFVKPSLNSGAFSRLNGGSGMGMSGGGMSGGGGGAAAPAAGALGGDPNAAAAAAAIGAAGAGGAPAAGVPDIGALMQQAQQKK